MRTILIWLAAAFVFGNFYTMIAARQTLLRNGQTCYLELAPVDPRSLMQGDYMALNYAVMNQLNHDHFTAGAAAHPDTGTIIVQLDSRNVGTFVRYDDGTLLTPGQARLKYHHDGWRSLIGAESFFIPEGSGDRFSHATYGELKLQPDGTPLIVALCDKDLHPITAADSARYLSKVYIPKNPSS